MDIYKYIYINRHAAMDDSPCRIGGVEVATPLGGVEVDKVEKGVDEVEKEVEKGMDEVEKGVGDEEEERRMLNSAARRYR
jgi:hypothetical protein